MEKWHCCRRRVVALLFIFLSLIMMLSIERAVIDALGRVWASMLLNCMAIVYSLVGLLGICVKDKPVIFLYAVWSVLSVCLNLLVVLIYNEVGHLAQGEQYLGFKIGNENLWRRIVKCNSSPNNSSEDGSGSYGGSVETECQISYSTIETIHAAVYMLFATVSFILCLLLLSQKKKRQNYNYDVNTADDEDHEDLGYVSVAMDYDYPWRNSKSRRKMLLQSLVI